MFGWWDSLALWLTGLPFVLQFALVMIVVMPVAVAVSIALDRLLDFASSRVRDQADDLDS